MGQWANERDNLRLIYYSAGIVTPGRTSFWATIRRNNGSTQEIRDHLTTYTEDRSAQEEIASEEVTKAGEIIDAGVTGGFGGIKRGEFYAFLTLQSDINKILCEGYLYETVGLQLGMHVENLGGPGARRVTVVANNVAPVDIQRTLSSPNARRRIDGFAWYYHCSGDVADRTLRASMRDLGDGLPTGMTSGDNTTVKAWPSAGVLTLSANQEGVIYANANTGKSFSMSNDNAAPTIEDITTNPDPFPYWAGEGDVGEIFFNVTLSEAADRHSIYLFQEEWIEQ